MQLFGGAINVYYAPSGSTNYAPLGISNEAGYNTVAPIPCPNN